MPRIPYAEEGSEADGASPVYKELSASFGMVPNLVKLVGHSGPATQGLGALLRTHFQGLSLPADVREIAYLTASRFNGCSYCQAHHEPLARQAGVTDAEIQALDPARLESGELDDVKRAVARFALETTRDVVASDEAVEELKKHFRPAAIAEIAFVVGAANMIQRIGRNLGVELEG